MGKKKKLKEQRKAEERFALLLLACLYIPVALIGAAAGITRRK